MDVGYVEEPGMKVVLFCGGYGMRMRSGESDLPTPMTTVGPRPPIWRAMRYYAHFGHKEIWHPADTLAERTALEAAYQ